MALRSLPTYTIVLHRFLPWYLVRINLLLLAAFLPLAGAYAFASALPVAISAVFGVWALLEVRRFTITTITLHDELAICSAGTLRTRSGSFRRRRVDIQIHRSFVGSLFDYGDVTLISEASQMTLHGIANLRVLEAWHAQQ